MLSQIDSYLSASLNNLSRMNILLCSIPLVNNRMMKIAETIYSNKVNKMLTKTPPSLNSIWKAQDFKEHFLCSYQLGFWAQSAITIAAFAAMIFSQPLSWGYVFFGSTFIAFGASSHDALVKYNSCRMRFVTPKLET